MSIRISTPPDAPIHTGHGEYVVYHQNANGEKTPPARALFDKAYALFNEFNTPANEDRYALIRGKLKQIDPTLEITFVPRTYYEFQFAKKCIKEESKNNGNCPSNGIDPYHPKVLEGCWHIAHFTDAGDNNAEAVKVLAFNLNKVLVKKIKKLPLEGASLKFKTIQEMTQKQINFFKKFSPNSGGDVANHFAWSLRIKDDNDAQIILNATALECSSIAKSSFLLYRGTDFVTDLPYEPANINSPYSFSFGESILTGALHDVGATPLKYILTGKDGYVLAVPAQEVSNSVFVIPKKHAICPLTGSGETFHARTQVWKTTERIWGFDSPCPSKELPRYISGLDKEELCAQVLNYKKNNSIFLKSTSQKILSLPRAFQPMVEVRCRVPFGQTLYIRGSSGALNWTKGTPLTQVAEDVWVHRFSEPFDSVEYKLLIEDRDWEEGNNHSISREGKSSVSPSFATVKNLPPVQGTRLTIKCNAGMGNSLFIRGQGPGLTWNKGTPLVNLDKDTWIWQTSHDFPDCQYKLLVNDSKWEKGPNHKIKSGKREEIVILSSDF